MTPTTPIGRPEIEQAAARTAGYVRTTPVLEVAGLVPGLPLLLKLELTQVSGSFKARGAFNLLLSSAVPAAGVVAASGGNFGLAVAHAAQVLGHRATIYVPESTPAAKTDRLRTLGAQVVVEGAYFAEAYEASLVGAGRSGALLAHAYDLPEVVAGAGTCAFELATQCPDLDTLLVAVGGGGLIGGIAGWYQGDVSLIAVETVGTPTLHTALREGGPVDVDISGVAASALGARRVGQLGFAAAQRWVSGSLLVEDDAAVAAQRLLWASCRIVCEVGTAAALAALLTGAYVPRPDERVGVLLCGANTDPAEVG